ncbi:hypothetical protein Tco_0370428 [Tanacetum coccineum]
MLLCALEHRDYEDSWVGAITPMETSCLLTKDEEALKLSMAVQRKPRRSNKYCDKHNQVGFLRKPDESAGFAEIVDFLRGSNLRGFRGAPRPLLPSMLLVATNPDAGQEHAAVAQSQPSSSTPQEPELREEISKDDHLDFSVQGWFNPSYKSTCVRGGKQVEDISPNTLDRPKSLQVIVNKSFCGDKKSTSSPDKGQRAGKAPMIIDGYFAKEEWLNKYIGFSLAQRIAEEEETKIEANAELSKSMLGSEITKEKIVQQKMSFRQGHPKKNEDDEDVEARMMSQRESGKEKNRWQGKSDTSVDKMTLKVISRDDLTELYRIVMNRYGMDGPEDELEKIRYYKEENQLKLLQNVKNDGKAIALKNSCCKDKRRRLEVLQIKNNLKNSIYNILRKLKVFKVKIKNVLKELEVHK